MAKSQNTIVMVGLAFVAILFFVFCLVFIWAVGLQVENSRITSENTLLNTSLTSCNISLSSCQSTSSYTGAALGECTANLTLCSQSLDKITTQNNTSETVPNNEARIGYVVPLIGFIPIGWTFFPSLFILICLSLDFFKFKIIFKTDNNLGLDSCALDLASHQASKPP